MAQETVDRNEDLDTLEERLTPEVIAEVDKFYLSPRERAEEVLAVLEKHGDFTRWDYACFGVETLGQMAIAYFNTDKLLLSASMLIGKWLNNLHYFYPEQVYGPREKGRRK